MNLFEYSRDSWSAFEIEHCLHVYGLRDTAYVIQHRDTGKFFYYEITTTDRCGPFDSLEAALAALKLMS